MPMSRQETQAKEPNFYLVYLFHQLSNDDTLDKAQVRRQLVKQGWKIGPSIGDQISDMAGGYLTHGFLLPNPMHYLP